MFESEPKRESLDQKPFVIRGHHLPHFALLVNRWQYGDTPQRLARRMRVDVERSCYPNDNDVRQEKEGYAQDVLGVGLGQADRFEKHLTRTFEEFLRLPDNHPAEIVEEVPDIICAGCAVGKHCRTVGGTEETRYLDVFLSRVDGINYLRRLRGEDQLPELVIQKQTIFAVAAPNKREIETTLGLVKRVLTRKPNEKNILFRSF